MKKYAKFVSLDKIPACSYLKQRAKIILSLDYNGHVISRDIYFNIKSATTRRITDKFCTELISVFKNFKFLIEKGIIVNLDEAIKQVA